MINYDAIKLLDWYYQQPDIFSVDEEVLTHAPEVINDPSHKPDPIINSEVLYVFWQPFEPDESQLDHQIREYIDRTDTYYQLKNHPIIEAFRSHFDCPEDLEYYEILDILFWRLGTLLSQIAWEPTPAEFLEDPEQCLKDRLIFLSNK